MLILLFQSCCSWYRVTTESTDAWVSLDKTRLTIEEGTTGEVTCSKRSGENGTVTWIDPRDQFVSDENRSRIHYNHDSGLLTLTEANLTDTGVYVCAYNLTNGCRDEVGGRKCNATLDCRVYVMPDYFVDGVVVLAINGVLLVVLIACFIRSLVSERRRRRKHGLQKL